MISSSTPDSQTSVTHTHAQAQLLGQHAAGGAPPPAASERRCQHPAGLPGLCRGRGRCAQYGTGACNLAHVCTAWHKCMQPGTCGRSLAYVILIAWHSLAHVLIIIARHKLACLLAWHPLHLPFSVRSKQERKPCSIVFCLAFIPVSHLNGQVNCCPTDASIMFPLIKCRYVALYC